MANKVKVWTKQHEGILQVLDQTGRFLAQKTYIQQKMEDHAPLYLGVYEWYFHRASKIVPPPVDAKYPIWVSLSKEERIANSEGNVILEVELAEEQLLIVDLLKWGNIVNHLYIPKDLADQKEHARMLNTYGIDDVTAFMTPFYPNIKRKIEQSHDRLFDDTSVLGERKVGTIWEIRKEWITKIIR